jgi:hypothetical protein
VVWFRLKRMPHLHTLKSVASLFAFLLVAFFGMQFPGQLNYAHAYSPPAVPGESYQICDEGAQYLTSPWTYDSLAAGTAQAFTVGDYENLTGYGTTLPPLPSYISSESQTSPAAVIFGPGAATANPAYYYPESPVLYFFEGGAYGELGLQTISGDEFIGGSDPNNSAYPEPQFNDGGGAGGIANNNDSFDFSGGATTLTSPANINDQTVNVSSQIPNYSNWITFSDGSTYGVSSFTSTTVTLSSPLTTAESSGSSAWANSNPPVATVAASAALGATSISLGNSSIPMVEWGNYVIGSDDYQMTSVSGSQSGYTLGLAGLDQAVGAGTPVYYNGSAGDVTVEYLDIYDDLHSTTGTITLGSGWTVEHNDVHDSYRNEGEGVALYGGDEDTIEYNCFSKMGSSGAGGSGTGEVFDYNEVYEAGYEGDPNCGCTGDKWWGSLNADIKDNAFEYIGIGGGTPAIWLDNGNSGTDIEGNYFYKDVGSAIMDETGYNMKVADNLFLDDGWGSGGSEPSNSDGAVNINSSGGINVPGSRFENQILVTGNNFVNDWEGVDIWQSTERSCLASGEGWPVDSAYCSGGFPTTAENSAAGEYYFSHEGNSAMGGTRSVAQAASAGSSTIMVSGSEAFNDQIGFADPVSITTPDRTDVADFPSITSTISATDTSGFPATGELRVDTSAAGGGGGLTGAILSYSGNTGTGFTGVALVRGEGTLTGPILQVQPYQVTGETCYANDCSLSITPSLSADVAAGTEVSNAGTCPLFATSVSLPSGPLAPSNVSYWDGCQWQSRNVAVSSNNFVFQPSLISNSAPPVGGGSTTQCTLANSCGTNFMAFQNGGTLPYIDDIGMNAMMSSSTFSGCPDWDSGCSTDPLADLNGSSSPPGAPVANGEAPYNNVWSANSYAGPWEISDAYSYSGCYPLPADGSNNMPNSDCGEIDIPTWQAAWQQDQGSTYTPIAVTLGSPTPNQEIFGPSQQITEYADSKTAVTGTLTVNGTTVSSASISSPHNWPLDTLNFADGTYTVGVKGVDTDANSASDSASVYISNGDLNGDGTINLSDLALMANHWSQTDSNYTDGNITGQSTINISDLAILAANWGWSHP